MKPQLLAVSKKNSFSFSARVDTAPDVNNRWHYHREIELIYFKKGSGTQFIGDNIGSFQEGDIVLVGSGLAHYWRFDEQYHQQQAPVEVHVIHFMPDFLGEAFLELPENASINRLLAQSKLGLQLKKVDHTYLTQAITELTATKESTPKRILLLLDALNSFSTQPSVSLASLGFEQHRQHENDRLKEVYNYTFQNFKHKISLTDIALVAKVSTNSFCKYFKLRTKKTYTEFVNEIRISHACKLLQEGELNVKEICYESGFFNFASFHKHFKSVMNMSPLTYQKTFLQDK